jgi:hypothetical protein
LTAVQERFCLMFRIKVGLLASGLVLAFVVATYLFTVVPMANDAEKRVRTAVERASRLVTRIQSLKGLELLALAESVAARKEFVHAVQQAEEQQRRIAVFDSIDQYDKKLKKEGRKAHFFGVVAKDGTIIARDLDLNNMYGEELPYRNVKEAVAGRSANDIWWWPPKDARSPKNKMMWSAAAPIRVGSEVKGAVVIAYEVTAADAREERDQFGTHVAYFMDEAVRASSFSMNDNDNAEDAGMAEALTREVVGSSTSLGKEAVTKSATSSVVTLALQGVPYLAIAGPLPLRLTNPNVGYVVLSSLKAAKRPVSTMRWTFLLLGLGMLLLVLGGMWVVARHFVDAEDRLELGVAEVINGNMEYTFDVVEEFEGLANALNVMLARMLGRPEPGEDEEESDVSWRADVLAIDELDVAASAGEVARQLAAEPDATYYARIFREYVEARRTVNLPVEGITEENLSQKLKANEALLRGKFKCERVRFVVSSAGGKVSLKPIRIG